MKYAPLLLGSAMLFAPQISSASLLLGISDFNTTPAGSVPSLPDNYIAAGFSGSFALLAGASATNTEGSADGTWGDLSFPEVPPAGNGTSSVVLTPNAFGQDTRLEISLTSSMTQQLGVLVFDGLAAVNGYNFDIRYQIDGGLFSSALVLSPSGSLPPTDANAPNNGFEGYMADITNVTLTTGQTIKFVIRTVTAVGDPSDNSAFLDNFAITTIPEPGSMMALGCFLGLGAFSRSRRRRN